MFDAADTAAVVAIQHTIFPEYEKESWHAGGQFDSERVTPYRYVAAAKELLAYGAIRYLRQSHGRIDLMVHPRWQRHGIGTNLIKRLLDDLVSTNSVAAHARLRGDHEEALSFLTKRGFKEHHRMYGLELDVGDAKLAKFWPLVNRLAAQGVKIATFAEESERDSSCTQKLLDLHNSVLPSWPDPEGVSFTPMVESEFVRKLEREVADRPDALFLAKIGELYVGYSGMFALGTAVRPEFRGRGIAVALKTHTVEYAKKIQLQTAMTCTANPAMLAINEKLGYQQR